MCKIRCFKKMFVLLQNIANNNNNNNPIGRAPKNNNNTVGLTLTI